MANRDTPMGFIPFRHRGGGIIRASAYKIQSAYATTLLIGDAVLLASGYITRAGPASASITGIFAGCRYRDSNGNVQFGIWLASTVTLNSEDVEAMVYDDEGISYRCQTDTDTSYVDATHRGGSFDVEQDHAGSTITGMSGQEIDLADASETQFLLLGLIDEPTNEAGVNAKVEVKIRKALLNLA